MLFCPKLLLVMEFLTAIESAMNAYRPVVHRNPIEACLGTQPSAIPRVA